MTDPTRNAIRAYYERNTRLFLRFGSSRQVPAIHRALWPPGITSLPQALKVSTEMLLNVARMRACQRIADLGCGVGATLFSLVESLPGAHGVGLTLSPLQAHLGARHALPGAHLLAADFHYLPLSNGFDLTYSIEAFVHASRAEDYLAEAARILRVGGQLVLIDDFRGKVNHAPTSHTWLDIYQRGWHAHNLLTIAEVQSLAGRFNLHSLEERDLTPLLRLRALPDPLAFTLLKALEPLWAVHPIIPSMLGSMSLQQCLRDGAITYCWLLFEKSAP